MWANLEAGEDPRVAVWHPPPSPLSLLEEVLYDNPWALLLACILLNKTSATQVRAGVGVGGGGGVMPARTTLCDEAHNVIIANQPRRRPHVCILIMLFIIVSLLDMTDPRTHACPTPSQGAAGPRGAVAPLPHAQRACGPAGHAASSGAAAPVGPTPQQGGAAGAVQSRVRKHTGAGVVRSGFLDELMRELTLMC